jgi:hypothetical protein
MTPAEDAIDVALQVADALEAVGAGYFLGGSLPPPQPRRWPVFGSRAGLTLMGSAQMLLAARWGTTRALTILSSVGPSTTR